VPLFMSKGYEVPSWGALPQDDFSLEVLKNGLVIDTIVLSKQDHFVIGRQPDVCDITMEHPSISRIHAILQYRDDGALMILDMKSAHGTYVNKAAMTEGVYQRLYVGDFVKFGASSRSYIVGGPEIHRQQEYDSANMQVYRKKLVERTAAVESKKKDEEDAGVGWGFREDAVNEDYEDEEEEEEELPDYVKNDPNYNRIYGEKFSSTLKDSEVNEKDAAVVEKIRKKEKKIQNMQEEIKRIYMKEGKQDEGLTSGQAAAVERNDKRIEVLKEEVDAMLKTLREKNSQREGTATSKTKKEEESVSSRDTVKRREREDEDYSDALDMTAETADVSTNWRLRKKLKQKGLLRSDGTAISASAYSAPNGRGGGGALTYEVLCQQRQTQQSALDVVMARLAAVDAVLAVTQSAGTGSDEGDGVDAYLAQTKHQEALESRKGLEQERDVKASELKRIERLVKIAAPDISSLSTIKEVVKPLTIVKPDIMPAVGNIIEIRVDPDNSKCQDKASESHLVDGHNGIVRVEGETGGGDGDGMVGADGAEFRERSDMRPASKPKTPSQSNRSGIGSLISSIQWSKPGDEEEEEEEEGSGDDGDGVAVPEKRVRGDRGGGRKKARVDQGSTSESHDDFVGASSSSSSGGGGGAPVPPRVKGPQRPSVATKAVEGAGGAFGGEFLEGGDKVWAPPKNQTGDGRTSLNAKYGY
jgi:hypothetical protein